MDRQTKLEGHAERNLKLVDIFQQKGVNLDEVRSIEVHFWARGQRNSARLAHELYKRGYMVLVLGPARAENADPDLWNIEAGLGASISKAVSPEFTAMITDLASEFDAEYDGWGTSV
jgi:regulator of RNase E activity RraB